MRVLSLASGSKGNAVVVEEGGAALLVDCGVCPRTLKKRLAPFAAALPAAPVAVLLTHSHGDHTKGLPGLLKKHPETVVYANSMTAEAVAAQEELDDGAFACFENGQTFEIGPFSVTPFPIPHDTSDPVGYLVRAGGTVYFHGTDIGTPLDSVGRRLAEADLATLESNHDPVLLKTSGRQASLIQRISGPRGHLSNDQACELVRRYASPRLKRLALAHLSQDCNAEHLAEGAMKATLAAMGRADLTLRVLRQDEAVEL